MVLLIDQPLKLKPFYHMYKQGLSRLKKLRRRDSNDEVVTTKFRKTGPRCYVVGHTIRLCPVPTLEFEEVIHLRRSQV